MSDELPDAERLALAHAPAGDRLAYAALFHLDNRLRSVPARASEPLLAQMRLAWWRERLGEPAGKRPKGDAVLDLIGTAWGGQSEGLGHLVDGFEALVLADDLNSEAIDGFCKGRADAWSALASLLGAEGGEAVHMAAYAWSLADLRTRLTKSEEREAVSHFASPYMDQRARMSRTLRPFAILGAAGRHSLGHDVAPMTTRGGIAAAWRAALTGR